MGSAFRSVCDQACDGPRGKQDTAENPETVLFACALEISSDPDGLTLHGKVDEEKGVNHGRRDNTDREKQRDRVRAQANFGLARRFYEGEVRSEQQPRSDA